jgi:hypothetical protein
MTKPLTAMIQWHRFCDSRPAPGQRCLFARTGCTEGGEFHHADRRSVLGGYTADQDRAGNSVSDIPVLSWARWWADMPHPEKLEAAQ